MFNDYTIPLFQRSFISLILTNIASSELWFSYGSHYMIANISTNNIAQLARAVDYTDCFSAEG